MQVVNAAALAHADPARSSARTIASTSSISSKDQRKRPSRRTFDESGSGCCKRHGRRQLIILRLCCRCESITITAESTAAWASPVYPRKILVPRRVGRLTMQSRWETASPTR
jgi:hypothetical protein